MNSSRRLWILIIISVTCSVLFTFMSSYHKGNGRVLVVQDVLDPIANVLEPISETSVERLNPYQLGHALPGLDGMAFVFSTQAKPYMNCTDTIGYVPLYSATVVIALNQTRETTKNIDGWQTLLNSKATLLMPHNATEGGRLAAAAIALGLGAVPGDYTPALEALSYLNNEDRLNTQDEYKYDGYNYMFNPERLAGYDAVVLWDYQARALMRISEEWDIIVPTEGSFTVNGGFVYRDSAANNEDMVSLRGFLMSEQGAVMLREAGFSPLTEEYDLSAWDLARLTYNPAFRREVLSVKLYGAASVLERLFLQSAMLLIFSVASQRVLRRIPRGVCRSASLFSMMFCALWLIIYMASTLSLYHDAARFLWFATYIPRHFLPICWYSMCYANRFDVLPPRKKLMGFCIAASLLCLFVFTNDLHRQMFVYIYENPATWKNYYENGWGYYLSLIWTFSLVSAGFINIFRNRMTHRQMRQMLYAGIFFAFIILYLGLYIAGIPYVIDLDIPVVVALLVLVFNLAAQRERFMGASLLELPIFQHLPYAIAIYNSKDQAIWRNRSMKSLSDMKTEPLDLPIEDNKITEILISGLNFRVRTYSFDFGRALVMEDITEITRLEYSLRLTQKKMRAVGELLIRQAEDAGSSVGASEREHGSKQMEKIFFGKLAEARRGMKEIALGGYQDKKLMRRVRFLICISQRRLRFILKSLKMRTLFPTKLLEHYVSGVVEDGKRYGLDAVISVSSEGNLSSKHVVPLLACIDFIFIYAFDFPGCSLICRMETTSLYLTFFAVLTWEDDRPPKQSRVLPLNLVDTVSLMGVKIFQSMEEDSLTVRLTFPRGEDE